MTNRLRSAALLCLTITMSSPAFAQTGAPAGRIIYCCNDSHGKQVCSDVLPQQCYGKAYREITPQGTIVRRVEAPLTPQERALKEAADKKAREEGYRRLEQDRKDRALLATYASEKDIDEARDRTIKDVMKSIRFSQDKLDELTGQQKKLVDEAEFFKKDRIPAELKFRIKANQAAIKEQQADIDLLNKEIGTTRQRYDGEKQRYRELTGKTMAGRNPEAAPAAPPTR